MSELAAIKPDVLSRYFGSNNHNMMTADVESVAAAKTEKLPVAAGSQVETSANNIKKEQKTYLAHTNFNGMSDGPSAKVRMINVHFNTSHVNVWYNENF